MSTPEEEELFRARMGLVPRTAQVAASLNPATALGLAVSSMRPEPPRPVGIVQQPPEAPVDMRPVGPGAMAPAPYANNPDVQGVAPLDPNYGLPPGMRAGGGVGGIGMPSRAAWDASRQKMLEDYETDKHLQYVQGANRADEIAGRSALAQQEAAIKQRHAEIQQEEDAAAAAKHEAFLQRNQQLADEIGQKQTSVEQVVGDTVGDIGMVVGGMLLAKAGHLDQAMAQFNKRMDDAIKRQQLELENKKVKLSARQSVFGQMMQESGDRRIAALQTRNLMLEATKQRLMADADRLGIPSAKTNAEMAVNKFQHEQDALNEQIQKESYASSVAAANAAASARAAAEERARKANLEERAMRVQEGKLEVDKFEAQNKGAVSLDKQIQDLGKELSDKDLAEGRSAVDNAKRRLAVRPADEGLPGVGGGADLRDKLAAKPQGVAALNPGAWANYAVAGLNDEERVSRGDWEKVKLSYQKQITGSGASENERAMISKAFEGAKSPAEQRAAIANADAFFQQLEQRKMAGFDPRAVDIYKQRLAAQGKK